METAQTGVDVWVPSEEDAWQSAVVINTLDDGNYIVKTASGEEQTVEEANVKVKNHFENLDTKTAVGVQDLTTLIHLHEPALLHVICERFFSKKIYTNTGPILLAVNPFEYIPDLYAENVVNEYYTSGLFASQKVGDTINLPPHVFKTADSSYRSLLDASGDEEESQNQSILVSGESGAGKTESTKHIMRYLATVANMSSGEDEKKEVADMVLKSNPILESFGNARTTRNDNSSRFGKFIEMQFDVMGKLVGARIKTYLLEKVRINTQALHERNYHIFYQLSKGADKELRKEIYLDEISLKECNMTNKSQCFERKDGVDDKDTWDEMLTAMDTMKFTKVESKELFRCVSALMHLSNIDFQIKEDEDCIFNSEELNTRHVSVVEELLGLQKESMEESLTKRRRVVNSEVFMSSNSITESENARDAVVKTIYSRMFDWIVKRVNESIEVDYNSNNDILKEELLFIGVLDIFGFEVFEKNSFEQLCINYTNETLQQQFNQFVFKLEQQEYERENITWTFIDFPDNEDVLRLIDKKPIGVLSLLDEQCLFPNGNDEQFARKLYSEINNQELFVVSNRDKVNFKFGIKHYAGLVVYDTEGFCEKNKDQLFQEALNLLQDSSSEFINTLFPKGETTADVVKTPKKQKHSSRGIQSATVGTQFKNQLGELMEVIKKTNPHYVRCLKPNDENRKQVLDKKRLIDQLRYSGVLEAVKVARAGYSVRIQYSGFVQRYFNLIKIEEGMGDKKKLIGKIMEELGFQLMDDYQIGKSKVFIRKSAYDRLEFKRSVLRSAKALIIQKNYRKSVERIKFLKKKQVVLYLQSIVRMNISRKKFNELRREKAALVVQKNLRMIIQKYKFNLKKKSTLLIQRLLRGYNVRKELFRQKQEKSANKIYYFLLMANQRIKFIKIKQSILSLQCAVRKRIAVSVLKKLKREAREVGNLKGKMISFQERISWLTSQLAEEKRKHQELKDKSKSDGDLNLEVDKLKKQLKEKDDLNEKLTHQIKLRENENQELKTELSKASLEIKESRTINERVEDIKDDSVLIDLRKENVELKATIEDLEKKAIELKSMQHSVEESKLETDVSKLNPVMYEEEYLEQVRGLKLSIKQLGEENKRIQEEKLDLEDRFNTVLEKQLMAANEVNELQESLNQVHLQYSKELEETSAVNKSLIETNAQLQEKVAGMEVLVEQGGAMKVGLAKRMEELLLEKRKILSINKRLKNKVIFLTESQGEMKDTIERLKHRGRGN